MNISLDDIEQRIENLIEIHLIKFLPGQSWHDRIAHRLAQALKTSLATNDTQNSAPSNFVLYVHPTILAQWQKEPRLLDGLTKIFRLVTNEAGLKFESAPTLTLAALESLDLEDVEVRISGEAIAETQKAAAPDAPLDEDGQIKSAFLIIGGTKVFTIEQMVINIGRRLDNQVVIDDPRISRYHAQLRYVRDKFVIFDLNSTGGTYVNGQRTSQSVLYPGDVISLAGLPIVFGQDNPPQGLRSTSGDTAPLSKQSSERKTAVLNTTPLDEKENKFKE